MPRLIPQPGKKSGRLGHGLVVFRLGHGVGHNTGADVEMDFARAADSGANGDVELALAIESKIADGSRVRPARDRLQFVDDFHGADFRRAGDAAARKTRGEGGKMRLLRAQPASDGG